jgi:hypothetical protein
MIQRLHTYLSLDEPQFFQALIPCPENENAVSYWGTKWDVYEVEIEEIAENTMRLSFNTAWTPPTGAYHELKKMGFKIDALFMESGCDFCGYWRDGDEQTYYDARENIANIPEDFHFYFCDDSAEEDED